MAKNEEVSLAAGVVIDTMEELATLAKRVAERDAATLSDISNLLLKLRDRLSVAEKEGENGPAEEAA